MAKESKTAKANANKASGASPKRNEAARNEGADVREGHVLGETGTIAFTSGQGAWPNLADIKRQALAPLPIVQRAWRNELPYMFAIFCFAIALYGLTTPRQVTLEDDGLFLMDLHYFGIGHPPGYPIYILLGSFFYQLMPDFLTPAFKGHMFSGFAAAIACLAIYAIVAMIVRNRACALLASMAYAASEAFWSQAIIAEVYTLNAAIYFIIMAMCLSYASHSGPRTNRHILTYSLIAFTYGLGLANHWPLLGLGSIALLLAVISQWRHLINVRLICQGLVLLALGLTPYLWMVFRSQMDVPLNFYGAINSLKELWFYVTRSGYSGVDNQTGVGIEEKIVFTRYFASQWGIQITWLGLAIAFVGFVAMLRSRAHAWLALCLLVAWFMTGPLLIVLVNFQAEFVWLSAFRVYHLLCYGITTVFFGYGLAWFGEWLLARKLKLAGALGLALATGVAVVGASVTLHWQKNDRSDYTWARDFAMFKLVSIEPNAHLFTFDDLDLPVGYLNYVENVRSDIRVYNDQGLVFGNRIYSPFTTEQRRKSVIASFIRKAEGSPVYYHTYRADYFKTPKNGSDFMGFWRRVNHENEADRVVLSDSLRLWLEDNIDTTQLTTDRWTRQQAAGSVATLISGVHKASQSNYQLTPEWQETIRKAEEKNDLVHFYLLWNKVARLEVGESEAKEEIAWIDSLFGKEDVLILDNSNWADLLLLRAQMIAYYPKLTDQDPGTEVVQTLKRALEFEFKYIVFEYLADVLRGQGKRAEAIRMLKERYPSISTAPNNFRELYNLMFKEEASGKLLRRVIKLDSKQ